MIPNFIFNGIDSNDYLIVNKLPSIFKASKDIQKIEIDGRDGFLTQDNGSYKSIIKPVECSLRNLDNIDYICSWLTGSGNVIFSNEPDKVYKAIIINQIEFSKILREFHSFIIQFECQPHKYSIDNNIITLDAPQTVFNPSTVNSKPIIKLYGTGDVNLIINENIINLTNVSEYVTIDSDIQDAFKDTLPKNNDMAGEFPEFIAGTNYINWSGTVTKIEITPNWRYL